DISLEIEWYPVKKIGSQGQKKTFLIALKLAQYVWLYRMNQLKPMLLLDDIFDKLDAERVEQIIRIVGGDIFGQIFITDTNREHIDEMLRTQRKEYTLFRVEGGTLF
ncbi:MAG: DNA replication and repair protein RecF, partial [Odoribacter sp.]|nr:DNA replication and repair protein RecF [Odoribacter sp.]